ncbi:MAG: formylglycine-generating enzyme family protein [Planctomycetes bacterium]|nr:formylglycine-generating enzyme family protein [Planctomycetota bacterium]
MKPSLAAFSLLLLAPACALAAEQPKIIIGPTEIPLNPDVELERSRRLEAIRKGVKDALAAAPASEAAALKAIEADVAYLIQTAPRPDDRLRALHLLTLDKWLAQLSVANRPEAARLIEMPEPFGWTWPADTLRQDLKKALAEQLQRQAPGARAQEFSYSAEFLPRMQDMDLCVVGQAFRSVLRQRIQNEQTPVQDAPLRWALETYHDLSPKATGPRVAELDKQYADKLAQARAAAQKGDKLTARAAFDAAAALRPLRSLAFLQRVVAELDWGAAIALDPDSPEGGPGARYIMALACLDTQEPEVCLSRALIVLKARGATPAHLDTTSRVLSNALAAIGDGQPELRDALLKLRAGVSERLGRKDLVLFDRALLSDTVAALLRAARAGDAAAAAAALDTMAKKNEWQAADLLKEVSSVQQLVAALRILNLPGLGALNPQSPVYSGILKNVRAFQKAGTLALDGGAFKMGGTADANEKPEHEVALSPFWIARSEATVGQYKLFLDELKAGFFAPPADLPGFLGDLTPANWAAQLADESKPVRGVDWFCAAAYAAWLRAQLPTEAQWEFAARGAAANPFPWGADADVARELLRQGLVRADAKTKDQTAQGLLHLAGNVAEWCRDTFDPAFYLRAPRKDPLNAAPGPRKALRGGSHKSAKIFDFRAARRTGAPPIARLEDVGLRIVIEP